MKKKELREQLIIVNDVVLKLHDDLTMVKLENQMLRKTLYSQEQELKQGQENYDKLWDMYSELKRENRVIQEYINETKDCMYCKEAKAIKIWDERSIR